MREKVSVIIPVYKVEKYLKECMNSVLMQDYRNIEVILVDDGSPDECPQLCDEYATNYDNIIVIHQTNKGAAEARNAGVMKASGEFLFFLDSDDCIDGNSVISRMVKKAIIDNADIVVGSYRRLTKNGISEVNFHHLKGGEYTKSPEFRFDGFYQYGHLAYNCGKLYRKSFLIKNDLYFPTYAIAEDKAHNIRCYSCGAKYSFLAESVFLYRINEESTTYKYIEGLTEIWISIAKDFDEFITRRNIISEYRDLAYYHIFFGIFFVTKQELQLEDRGIRDAARVLKKYGKNPFVKKSMNALIKGKCLGELESLLWRLVIWNASLLFVMHGYLAMTVGIALLRKLEVDRKITKSRYKKEKRTS